MSTLVESLIKALMELLQKLLTLFFLWLQSEINIQELVPDTIYFSQSLLGGHLDDIVATFGKIGIIIAFFLFIIHAYFLWTSGVFTDNKDTFIGLIIRMFSVIALMALGQPLLDTVLDKGMEVLDVAMSDFGESGTEDGYLNDVKTSSLFDSASNMEYSSFMTDEMIEQMIISSDADISVEEFRKIYDSTTEMVDNASSAAIIPPVYTLVEWLGSEVGKKYIESKTGVSVDIVLDSTLWLIFNGLINIILYGVLAYYYFKLIFELVKRYATTMILKMCANVGNALFSSSATQMAFFSYYKMFFCEVFVLVFTKIWIRLSLYMMEHSEATLLACLCCIVFVQFGTKLEQTFKELGLTVYSNGSSFLDSIAMPAMVLIQSVKGGKNAAAYTMTGMGSLTGSAGLVVAGNALSGKSVSPVDVQKTMESNPLGRVRMASIAKSGIKSINPSINKNAARMLKENGLFRNSGFNSALNSQTASGKKDILNNIGDSMFSNFKNEMAVKGIGVDFNGYDMNKGLAFSGYSKNGDLVGTGFITDSIPKNANSPEFKVYGDDGSIYYGGFTIADTFSKEKFNGLVADLIDENGLFGNKELEALLNFQTDSGKEEILNNIGDSTFSSFKAKAEAKGVNVQFKGYNMNRGLAFSEYDKDGSRVGTGFITEKVPEIRTGHEFTITGDNKSIYYCSFRPEKKNKPVKKKKERPEDEKEMEESKENDVNKKR